MFLHVWQSMETPPPPTTPGIRPFGSGVFFAIPGAVFLLYILIDAGLAVARMVRQLAQQGTADAQLLGRTVGELLVTLAARGFVALPVVAVLVLALLACRYRAVWFYRYLLAVSPPLMLLAPFGTLFGAWFVIYLWKHRREFVA